MHARGKRRRAVQPAPRVSWRCVLLLCCVASLCPGDAADGATAAADAYGAEVASVAAVRCPAGCTAHGNCNAELGVCDCPLGRRGAACEEDTLGTCALAATLNTECKPGLLTSCACAFACSIALKRSTEHPFHSTLCLLAQQPPVDAGTEALDAYLRSEQGWPNRSDAAGLKPWSVAAMSQCRDGCSGRGVCRAETRGAVCHCAPGFQGEGCERVAEDHPPCLNDCSGRGTCSNGTAWCACQPGFWGLDCALSMDATGVVRLWGDPNKGRPPLVQRPHVYIYHLPPEFGAYLSPHYVDRANAEMLLERLASSEFRVADPKDADYFYVPVPVKKLQDEGNCRQTVRAALAWVAEKYPFWNATRARHLLVGTADSDPVSCVGGDRLGNETDDGIVWLVHHGTTSSTPFFRQGKDVVIPPLNLVNIPTSPLLPLTRGLPPVRPPPERNITLFWAGTVWRPRTLNDTRDDRAWNVRRTMYDTHKNTTGFVLRDTKTEGSHPGYADAFATSRFCLSPAGQGGGWGRRGTLAALYGCVPLVIQDDTEDAFGELLDWRTFSVKVAAMDVATVPDVLAAVTPEQYAELQRQLACAAPRWLYSSVFGASAGEDGADDAVATLLELLWHRLQRDSANATDTGPFAPCELTRRRRCAPGAALPPTHGVPPEWRTGAPVLRPRARPAYWPAGGAACHDRAPDDRPCPLPPNCTSAANAIRLA